MGQILIQAYNCQVPQLETASAMQLFVTSLPYRQYPVQASHPVYGAYLLIRFSASV